MYRSGPDDKEFEDWHNYLINNENETIEKLAAEGKDDDWRSLKLNLSNLREKNAELYDRILYNPIRELEKGEFILQKLIEEKGGHFEISLQYTGLGEEHYTDPADISTKDVGRLITFDGYPVLVNQILPWHKKAAWKCKSCTKVTLKDNPKLLKILEPEICDQLDGGCGALNAKYINQYFKLTNNPKTTTFRLDTYKGTLLDLRFLVLAEFENCLMSLDNMVNVEKSKTINSIAVGAIARAITTKNNFMSVTGMVTISDEGNMFELEILGIQEMPSVKYEIFEQRYSMNNSTDEEE